MKLQKQLMASLAGAAFFGTIANAEIPLTEDLSAYGYIDMAATSSNDISDGADAAFAEFELGFAFAPEDSQWSAVAELAFIGTGVMNGREDGDVDYETVTISYAYSDELSFTVGNILSYQGFETFDATGLYQFSAQGSAGYVYSAAYWFGASADYSIDDHSVGVWVGDNDDSQASWELFYQFTGVDGLTATAVYANDPGYETINLWASYEIDAFTFAAEYTGTDFEVGPETEVFMLLAFYSFGDAGVTFRYSEGEELGVDFDKITFSPSYSFSDNVFGLLEISEVDVDGLASETQLAAEIIFSF